MPAAHGTGPEAAPTVKQRKPSLAGRSCVVLVTALLAIAGPVEVGVGQTAPPGETEPAPAPDPLPDPNPEPTPPPSPSPAPAPDPSPAPDGETGGGDIASGSSAASPGTRAAREGTGSTATSARRQSEAKRARTRQEPRSEGPGLQATPGHEPHEPSSGLPNSLGLGFASPEGATRPSVELFVVGLGGALALALFLVAVMPPHLLGGVSVVLCGRRRQAEIIIAAVLVSLVVGLFAARAAAQLG